MRNRGSKRFKEVPPHKVEATLERVLPLVNEEFATPLPDIPKQRVFLNQGRILVELDGITLRLTVASQRAADLQRSITESRFQPVRPDEVLAVEFLAYRKSPGRLLHDIETGKQKTFSLDDYRRMFPFTEDEIARLRTADPLPLPVRTDAQGKEYLVSAEFCRWSDTIRRLMEAEAAASGEASA